MKKLTIIISIILLFSSCDSKEESYASDPKIDTWVKENKEILNAMDRIELSKLDLSDQKAALRMFTPERKKQLWTEKLNFVLKNTSFTDLENNHLVYIQDVLKKHDFEIPYSQNMSDEIEKWMKEGQSKFNWTNEFLFNSFFIVGNGNLNKVMLGGGVSCECSFSVYCYFSGPGSSCTGGCEVTYSGCGVFGGGECDGTCQ